MSRNLQTPCAKQHKVFVVLGEAAVAAYLQGEARTTELTALGAVQTFKFFTLPEANAFMYGIEVAAGYDDAMAVEDLLVND